MPYPDYKSAVTGIQAVSFRNSTLYKWLKKLAAKDVSDFIIRHKENEDLDERPKEVEKRLAEKRL